MEIDLTLTDDIYKLSQVECKILSKEYAKTMFMQYVYLKKYGPCRKSLLWKESNQEIIKFIQYVYYFVRYSNKGSELINYGKTDIMEIRQAQIFVYLIRKNGYATIYGYFLPSYFAKKHWKNRISPNGKYLSMAYDLVDLNKKHLLKGTIEEHYASLLTNGSLKRMDLILSVSTMCEPFTIQFGKQIIKLMFFHKKDALLSYYSTFESNQDKLEEKYMNRLFLHYSKKAEKMYISLAVIIFLARIAFADGDKCSTDMVQSCINDIISLCLKNDSTAIKSESNINQVQGPSALETSVQNKIVTSSNNKSIISFINDNVLYIGHKVDTHIRKHHEVIAVTGILKTLRGKEAKINTNYCKQCGKYLISTEEYNYYVDKYAPLLGRFSFAQSLSHSINGMKLADKSILKLCGYSVGQADGLRPADRQAILANIVDNKILPKGKVIELLDWFINFHGNKQNMQNAVDKWLEDLDWLRNYHIDIQKHYNIHKTSYR